MLHVDSVAKSVLMCSYLNKSKFSQNYFIDFNVAIYVKYYLLYMHVFASPCMQIQVLHVFDTIMFETSI